jgi:lysophospholipase
MGRNTMEHTKIVYPSYFEKALKTENSKSSVSSFAKSWHEQILPFFHASGEVGHFLGMEGKKLAYKVFKKSDSSKHLVILTGYNESYLKYAQVIHDFYHQGFNVYVYDHRGQGLSERFVAMPSRAYVDQFEHMVDDLELFYNMVVKPELKTGNPKVFALGHSMGGAVLSAAIGRIPLHGYVLVSPMHKISFPPLLEFPSFLLAKSLSIAGLGEAPAAPSKTPAKADNFEVNDVTHSLPRFSMWRHEAKNNPRFYFSAPSFHWVSEAINFSRKVRKGEYLKNPEHRNFPVLLLQAPHDRVVDATGQDEFIDTYKNVQKIPYEYARHEILMEVDLIRNDAFHKICGFLEKHSKD